MHLGSATDVRVGDKFYATGLMDKTVFHMIDWPKAMSAQWGDSVKLATPRGQLLQERNLTSCYIALWHAACCNNSANYRTALYSAVAVVRVST